jgi:hypothetical protein
MFLVVSVYTLLQVAISLRHQIGSTHSHLPNNGDPIINHVLDFADPDASMAKKLKAARSEQYKKMWPLTCTGQNRLGEAVFSSFADGFRCLTEDKGAVAQPIAPAWYPKKAAFICCKSKCEDALYSDCQGVDLSDAALRMVEAVDNIEVGGKDIAVVHTVISDEDRSEGILQQLAIHIPENFVSFVREKPILTPDGGKNLHAIADKVVALLSMLSTANSGSKLLACPHGATTACLRKSDGRGKPCNPIGRRLHKLPHQRASVVADELKKRIDGIEVGKAFGHFKYEKQSDFASGRYGAIIIKAYNASLPNPPACNFDDLYDFFQKDASVTASAIEE